MTGANQVGGTTIFVWYKMVRGARGRGYDQRIKGSLLKGSAELCYGDERVIGERVVSRLKTVEVLQDLPEESRSTGL